MIKACEEQGVRYETVLEELFDDVKCTKKTWCEYVCLNRISAELVGKNKEFSQCIHNWVNSNISISKNNINSLHGALKEIFASEYIMNN